MEIEQATKLLVRQKDESDQAKSTIAKLKDELATLEFNTLTEKQACDTLRSQIVRSPERVQRVRLAWCTALACCHCSRHCSFVISMRSRCGTPRARSTSSGRRWPRPSRRVRCTATSTTPSTSSLRCALL